MLLEWLDRFAWTVVAEEALGEDVWVMVNVVELVMGWRR